MVFSSIQASSVRRGFFLFCLILLSIVQRWQAFFPDSFWYDDAWTAALLQFGSISDYFELKPGMPIGYLTLMKFFYVESFAEASAQVPGILLSILQIPFAFFVVRSVTKRDDLAWLTTAIITISPSLNLYSMRVKPYIFDSFSTLVVFYAAFSRVNNNSKLPWYVYPLILFSFPAFMVIACFLFLPPLYKKRLDLRLAPLGILMAGYYLLVARHQTNPTLLEFWQEYFLPLDSFSNFFAHFLEDLTLYLKRALPANLRVLAVFIPFGIYFIWKNDRDILAGIASLALFVIALAALSKYPIGAGRTDVYSHPLLYFVIACGLSQCLHKFPRTPIFVITILVLAGIQSSFVRPITYVEQNERSIIETFNEADRKELPKLLSHHAPFFIALYGNTEVKLIASRRGTGFSTKVFPETSHTLWPETKCSDLQRNFPHDKFLYVSAFTNAKEQSQIDQCFTDFQKTPLGKSISGSNVYIFERI